jgi:hypothetical protein
MKYLFFLVTLVFAVGCEREVGQGQRGQASAGEVDPAVEVELIAAAIEVERQAKIRSAQLIVDESVKGFKVMHRRFPESLDELVQKDMLRSLPDLPPGERFTYDKETGEVGVAGN